MALQDIIDISLSKNIKKIGVSEERINAVIPELKKAFSFYREYPDLLVDFLVGENNPQGLKLYFYQRVFLRAIMRHRISYATFPRAYSKSFLSVLVLAIRCILHPNAKVFTTSGYKEQAAGIVKEKMEELCKLIPGLRNEIDWRPGKTLTSKDSVKYQFKNGSVLDIVASKQSSRGKRKHGGLIEELILVKEQELNEVILPMMNVSRKVPGYGSNESEVLNKSQIYVTTAGWKNSFAYRKLLQTLVQQITTPGEAIVLGGTWKVPVMEKLLSKSFIRELKLDGTYNESSFAREYKICTLKILRIAGNLLESCKLQHKDEICLSVNV